MSQVCALHKKFTPGGLKAKSLETAFLDSFYEKIPFKTEG
ncbi:MAG: hypothetical protein [Olavius algarvensis Gamma 1 endosymbiont]|nr:MAG: hypothetical protein [Olavius algarvensis Gamma 1 endosymbiont]